MDALCILKHLDITVHSCMLSFLHMVAIKVYKLKCFNKLMQKVTKLFSR